MPNTAYIETYFELSEIEIPLLSILFCELGVHVLVSERKPES